MSDVAEKQFDAQDFADALDLLDDVWRRYAGQIAEHAEDVEHADRLITLIGLCLYRHRWGDFASEEEQTA